MIWETDFGDISSGQLPNAHGLSKFSKQKDPSSQFSFDNYNGPKEAPNPERDSGEFGAAPPKSFFE